MSELLHRSWDATFDAGFMFEIELSVANVVSPRARLRQRWA